MYNMYNIKCIGLKSGDLETCRSCESVSEVVKMIRADNAAPVSGVECVEGERQSLLQNAALPWADSCGS